jgi:hypothetical protein
MACLSVLLYESVAVTVQLDLLVLDKILYFNTVVDL